MIWSPSVEQLQGTLNRIAGEGRQVDNGGGEQLAVLIKKCRALGHGKVIHAHILKSEAHRGDKLLLNLLVEMYGRCGSVADARAVFQGMNSWLRNVYSWSMMIVALGKNGEHTQAVKTFEEMLLQGVRPNNFTLTGILSACCDAGDLEAGRRIDEMIYDTEFRLCIPICNSLISMYGKCGSVEEAKRVFDAMASKNNISWTAIIHAHCRNGEFCEAVRLFHQMELEGVRPCEVTLLAVIEAVGRAGAGVAAGQGKLIHARIIHSGWHAHPFLATSLITMYSRCGSVDDARAVFQAMSKQDAVAWHAMISAVCLCDDVERRNGMEEAVQLLSSMQQQGVKPVGMTVVAVIEACGWAAAQRRRQEEQVLRRVRKIEQSIVWEEEELMRDRVVASSLIHTYGASGAVEDARRVFEQFDICSCVDVVAWSSLVTAYADNGHTWEALRVLYVMENEGVTPNAITFVSILFACAHAGLLEHGCRCFAALSRERGIQPLPQHYGCMIDLLGRAGRFQDAETFITTHQQQDDPIGLTSLLCAYKLHGHKATAAAAHALGRRSESGPYVLLSSTML